MAEQPARTIPWKALGFEKRDVDAVATYAVALFTGWKEPPDSPERIQFWAFDVHVVASKVFALGALGYTVQHPVLRHWREAGRRLVAADLYYFFGTWREKVLCYDGEQLERKQARARLPWIAYFRDGLTTALSLSDWVSADRLLEWPGPDLNDDEGFDDRLPDHQ